jgi:hypothetical protein
MITQGVVAAAKRYKRRKMKRIEKLGQKYEKYKFDCFCRR